MLCEKCKKETLLEGASKETIERIFNSIDDPKYKEGVSTDKIFEPVGCSECNNLGYKGRTGIYEAILIDKAIEDAVIKNPSERDIREAAKPQKLLTLSQDGILKILTGVTSIEELSRVVDLAT
jgi:type II secretory ATPase GspE/PulE/Tfp pilus assembly ATPase PilB-like protein